MRLLLLISTVVMGASLLGSPVSVFAASTAKAHKSSHASSHKKSKQLSKQTKQKATYPGDVWKRISSGLQLPRPSLEQMVLTDPLGLNTPDTQQTGESYTTAQQAGNNLGATTPAESPPPLDRHIQADSTDKSNRLVTPATAMPKNNYTALGRKLLANNLSKTSTDCTPKQNRLTTRESVKTLKTRVRTQFNFHPERHRHTILAAKTVLYQERMGQEKDLPCINNAIQKLAEFEQRLPAVNTQPLPASESQPTELLADQQRIFDAQRNAKLMINYDRVHKYVDWYTQRRYYLYEVAERARPYLYHIAEGLSRYSLPLDLALLPIVESAYQPTAQSPKNAAGLWQFIPSTGEEYNLKQDSHYDERLDIAASTQAAIRYLSFLKQHFNGDWLLALAAYNCGVGRVDDAISRNIAEGLNTDYWSLQLPEETQEYVPRLLALATLFANPDNYKLKLTPIRNELYFINVTIDRQPDIKNLMDKDFKSIAQLANISFEQFSLLNPGYLGSSLPLDRLFSFYLPIANANQLHQRLMMLATLDMNTQKTVPPFALSESRLSTISSPFLSLNVKTITPPIATAADTATPSHQPAKKTEKAYLTVHYLDQGETLQSVAKHFGVSVEDVRKTNKFKRGQTVALGQRLTIPPKKATTVMLEASVARYERGS